MFILSACSPMDAHRCSEACLITLWFPELAWGYGTQPPIRGKQQRNKVRASSAPSFDPRRLLTAQNNGETRDYF